MALKRKIQFIVAVLSLISLSCHPGLKIEVMNNTGGTITIVSADTALHAIRYHMINNETAQIAVPYRLQIRSDAAIWDYIFPSSPLPSRYRKRLRSNWFLEKY